MAVGVTVPLLPSEVVDAVELEVLLADVQPVRGIKDRRK
jgi:hypothetical protein